MPNFYYTDRAQFHNTILLGINGFTSDTIYDNSIDISKSCKFLNNLNDLACLNTFRIT